MISPFRGAAGFLSVGSCVTAYLTPAGVVMISLAVTARDGCGCEKMDVPPTTAVATDFDRKLRLLPKMSDAAALDSLPIDNENAAALGQQSKKRTLANADFVMVSMFCW